MATAAELQALADKRLAEIASKRTQQDSNPLFNSIRQLELTRREALWRELRHAAIAVQDHESGFDGFEEAPAELADVCCDLGLDWPTTSGATVPPLAP